MTILLTAAVLLLCAGVAAFWYFGNQPARHRQLVPGRLQMLLDVLLRQGLDGGVLLIEDTTSPRFVQVMKYVGRQDTGLQLDLPRAPWSEPYIEPARRCLSEMGVPFTEAATGHAGTEGFITVDFRRDVALAQRVVTALAERVLQINLASTAVAQLIRVSRDPNARIGLR